MEYTSIILNILNTFVGLPLGPTRESLRRPHLLHLQRRKIRCQMMMMMGWITRQFQNGKVIHPARSSSNSSISLSARNNSPLGTRKKQSRTKKKWSVERTDKELKSDPALLIYGSPGRTGRHSDLGSRSGKARKFIASALRYTGWSSRIGTQNTIAY